MLLKGIEETKEAARPLASADMVLVRLAHAADLPTPDEALKTLKEGGSTSREASPAAPRSPGGGARMATGGGARFDAPSPQTDPAPMPQAAGVAMPRLESFADVVAMAGSERDLKLKHALETYVRLVSFEPGKVEVALTEHAPRDLVGDLSSKLEQWTGQRWMIAVGRESGAQTIEEVRKSDRARLVDDARADPVVAAVLERFPGAEIVDVRVRADEAETLPESDAVPYMNPDETPDEDD
jgi:DNA polymerase-3 subunit gamma/tau